ncbi:UNVERIFIED_CONTAM: saccharopine dehydrogenase domain-containing protein [Hammondia hammondi]|eukprot:XP_008886670.1 saccharopine dehydrogenase domain-containing protein [Hammondia hammondi]
MEGQPLNDAGREFDVIVYGATGFTGRLVAEYFCQHYVTENGEFLVRFALAGRSMKKLEESRQTACTRARREAYTEKIPLIAADSSDEASLAEMCRRAKVIITTVGPYLKYGEPLVKACVDSRTHYCDLVGEAPFVALTSQKYGRLAAERGVKVVHCCGFDSVPSDLSCLLLQDAALKAANAPCELVSTAVTQLHGGFSGGTVASLLNLAGSKDTFDPYYLCKHALPEFVSFTPSSKAYSPVRFMTHDKDFGYGAFFIMAPLNEQVVRWSNALMGFKYGKDFVYRELMSVNKGGFFSALTTSLLVYAGMLCIKFSPIRSLLFALRLLPQPGEGPSQKVLDSGFFEMRAVGRTRAKSGQTFRVSVTVGSKLGDPGYRETAKMIAETGLCMALNMDKCTKLCGVGSPSASVGTVLRDRLEKKGFYFQVDTHEEEVVNNDGRDI